MARAFRATTYGYVADIGDHERRLLTGLCGDVMTLLEHRGAETSPEPTSPEHDQAPGTTEDAAIFAHFEAELAGLGTSADQGLSAPDDPALQRLLPEAHQDTETAEAFRHLAEPSLRESKIADLRTTRMLLESTPVRLKEDQAPIFGRALNDVRLTLSARLGIDDEQDTERVHQLATSGKVTTTEGFMAEIYTFVTWLQETLFSAMIGILDVEDDTDNSSD